MSGLADALAQMLPADRAEFFASYNDFWSYSELAPLMVDDKLTRELVPMRPNPAQRVVWKLRNELRKSGELDRVIIPKARQLGMTTAHTGELFHNAAVNDRRQAYILMHDLAPAQAVYNKLTTFLRNIDPVLRPSLSKYSEGRLMVFDNESRILVESVKKQGVGRSETLDHVHATELPSYDDAEKTLTGIEQSVPDIAGGRTSITLESTCEGIGDYWHYMCKRAERGLGQYKLMFLPWWIEPAYRLDVTMGMLKRDPLTTEEEAIGKQIAALCGGYGMTLTNHEIVCKLFWRRRKMENMANADKFQQEYPMDLNEAFRGTGRPVFPAGAVRFHRLRMLEDATPAICEPRSRYEVKQEAIKIVEGRERKVYNRVPSREGRLKVWEPPVAGARYILPCDVASGEAADFSSIHVLKLREDGLGWSQDAVWHGHVGAKELAYILTYLWSWYNPKKSLMMPERTGSGLATVETILHDIRPKGMRMYQYEHRDLDTMQTSTKFGFNTSTITRPVIIDEFLSVIQTPHILIRDELTLGEIESFVFNKKGKAEAAGNSHDDLVMPLMFGNYARLTFRQGRIAVKNNEAFGYSHVGAGKAQRQVVRLNGRGM